MCLHTSVNLSRGRAVTNVGRTCGPTPLLVLLVILSCSKICLYYQSHSCPADGQRYINITRHAIGPKSGQKDCRKFKLERSSPIGHK